MEFLPTPFWHTPQGHLPDLFLGSAPNLDIITFVLPMLTRRPFPSILHFHLPNSSFNSGRLSAISTRSSAYSNSLDSPFQSPLTTQENSHRCQHHLPHIHLKPDATPYARHVSIPTPFNLKAEVNASLDADVTRGIIKHVPTDTTQPTTVNHPFNSHARSHLASKIQY